MDSDVDSTPEVEPADAPDALDAVLSESLGDYQELPPEETGPARDESGRFVSKSNHQGEAPDDDPASADDETEPAEAKAEDDEDSTPDDETEQALEAPEHWSADDKEKFAKAPRDIQEWMVDRSKAVDRAITEKTQALAEERKELEPIKGLLGQWKGYFDALGQKPDEAVNGLLRADHVLRTGTPERKIEAFKILAREYGIPLTGEQQDAEGGEQNPEVAALKQELAALKNELGGFKTHQEQTELQQTQALIDSFATAKDADGNLLHPHFETVKAAMGDLISSAVRRGNEMSLEDAYAKAIRLDDALYQETLEAERKKIAEADERKRKEAAEKARRQGRRAGGTPPGGQPSTADLDALIGNALEGRF